MPRLRIKTTDGKLERITVPDNITLRDLKELIARDVVHNAATTPVKLSLNNQVPGPCHVQTAVDVFPLLTRVKLAGFRWSLKAHNKTPCKQLASAVVISCGSWDLQTTRSLMHHLIDVSDQAHPHLFLFLLPSDLLQLMKSQQYPWKRQHDRHVCLLVRKTSSRDLKRWVDCCKSQFDSNAAEKVRAPLYL